MLLADACTEYVFSCKVRRLSEKTIDNYRKQILYWNRYLDEVCDVQEVEKVRPIHIKNFIILKEKDKRKPAYINDLLKAYRSFFNYCVEEEYIDESPLAKVKNVKEPRVIINTFTLTDIKKMLDYYSGADYLSVRNRAILAALFDSGIRCAELMSLTDLFLLDIKQIHDDKHRELTGFSNQNILELAQYLSDQGKHMWIRHVLVPGITTDEDDLKKTREFIDTLKTVDKVEVLPYHKLGIQEWERLGIPYKLEGIDPPTEEQQKLAKSILEK